MTQPLGPTTLHTLLGLPPTVDVERLRYVYEQAMAAATRRGDRARALTLSRAYDALPGATRQRMFPRTKARAAGPVRTAVLPASPALPPSYAQAAPRRRQSSSAFKISDRTIRLLIWLLGVPIAVVAGTAVGVHEYASQSATPPNQQPMVPAVVPAVVEAPSVPPAQIVDRHRRLIPADAPTDATGYVEVLCQRRSGGPGYQIQLRRGQIAYCTNGAIPTIVG